MPTVKGVLGQAAPAATTEVDLYTCPVNKNATGRVIVTNREAAPTTFRVSIGVDGAVTEDKQYITKDKAINGNDTGSTIAFLVGSTDVIRVFAGNANISFMYTGIEEDDDV